MERTGRKHREIPAVSGSKLISGNVDNSALLAARPLEAATGLLRRAIETVINRQSRRSNIDQGSSGGGGVEQQAYRRIVARVALLEGGTERLAVLLGVSSGLVSQWIQGLAPLPPDMLLRCVDYLLDQLPSDLGRPSATRESKLTRPE